MNNARQLSEADRERELEKLDLLPKGQSEKRADDLLRTLLNSPPDPQTPKPKPKPRAKK
jgi:hypothetical protein